VIPPVAPVPARRSSRGAGFWLLIAGGAFGACCVLPGMGLLVLGIIGSAETPASSSGGSGSGGSGSGGASASAEADDFLYTAPDGMSWIATNEVVAEGVKVTLAGEWREEHRNIVLRLRDGGTYELVESGSVAFVHDNGSFSHADSSTTSESGTWTYADGNLTLTPGSRNLHATTGTTDLGSEKQSADAPRQWSVVGVTIQYTPHDGGTRQRPGLHVQGPSPTWYYPPGNWDLVLRSAPFSG
jgi:hypothetical protein